VANAVRDHGGTTNDGHERVGGSGLAGRDWRRLDESDVRVRPGKGSRPRSKRRPAHADAVAAMVVAVDRGRWRCAVDGAPDRVVTAMRARELGRTPIVVGDRVQLVGDVSGRPDTLARIVRVAERDSVLRRTADDTDPYERVVVANAEQLLIVTSLADPAPRTGFIDRCLVACYTGGLEPVLCLTKADLAPPDDLLAYYADLKVPAVVTRYDGDVSEVADLLRDRVSALVGHSGVGKSTLVNRVVPDADLATGEVSAVGKGRHTSVSAVALPLPDGGWVVDTPGVRSFGLAHVTPDEVVAAFPEFAEAAEECPSNCGHLGAPDDPDCVLDEVVASGAARATRLSSLRRLLASRGGAEV
jgi:ribosome biogenesis GTPase